MTPEYKFYHGAVLAELIDSSTAPVDIQALREGGRLLNYVLNSRVAIQVKFSTQRLRPWQFTFPKSHVEILKGLVDQYQSVFVVLICWHDGFIAVDAKDVIDAFRGTRGETAWLRADRKKREMYRLFGPNGEFSGRLKTDLSPIISELG